MRWAERRSIAANFADKKADCILAAKESPGHLLAEIKGSFQMLAADANGEEKECGFCRGERRRCSVIGDLSLLEKASEWSSSQGM